MRRLGLAFSASLAVAVASLPTTAAACSCRPPEAELVRPTWPEGSGLELISESLELDCDTPNHCRWRSVHVYARAEPGEAARAAMVLPFSGYDSLQVRFGGQPVEPLADEEVGAVAAELRSIHHVHADVDDYRGVYVWLEDDGSALSVELEVTGEVHGNQFYWRDCCRVTALEIRHWFVADEGSANSWPWFEWKSGSVDPEARTTLEIDTARGILVETGLARRSTRRHPVRLEAPSARSLGFSLIGPPGITGGPFVGVGGAILDANPVRGRIGWEHAYPYSFLFYSAALETDFREELTLAPAVELTHGHGIIFIWLPVAGFGVGAPVQILPEPRPGVRAQASLSWPVVSFLTTFDWLPELPTTASGRERPHAFKLAFMGQLSF